jgi:hypothetical protein
MQQAIMAGIAQILSFVDDRGETHFARRERLDGRLAPPGRDDEDTVIPRTKSLKTSITRNK